MRAILINEETLEKIAAEELDDIWKPVIQMSIGRRRYLITGFYSQRTRQPRPAILPERLFRQLFEFDPVKIQTEFDLIVRR